RWRRAAARVIGLPVRPIQFCRSPRRWGKREFHNGWGGGGAPQEAPVSESDRPRWLPLRGAPPPPWLTTAHLQKKCSPDHAGTPTYSQVLKVVSSPASNGFGCGFHKCPDAGMRGELAANAFDTAEHRVSFGVFAVLQTPGCEVAVF